MTDLICRKTMRRCMTESMCAPFQGCQHEPGVSAAELDQLRYQNLYLLKVYDAAKNLVKVKGRHHSEQAYMQLCQALDDISQDK